MPSRGLVMDDLSCRLISASSVATVAHRSAGQMWLAARTPELATLQILFVPLFQFELRISACTRRPFLYMVFQILAWQSCREYSLRKGSASRDRAAGDVCVS